MAILLDFSFVIGFFGVFFFTTFANPSSSMAWARASRSLSRASLPAALMAFILARASCDCTLRSATRARLAARILFLLTNSSPFGDFRPIQTSTMWLPGLRFVPSNHLPPVEVYRFSVPVGAGASDTVLLVFFAFSLTPFFVNFPTFDDLDLVVWGVGFDLVFFTYGFFLL